MIEALIFDMDGVVADTEPAHGRSWARLAAEEGLSFDTDLAARLRGRTRADALAIFAGACAPGEDWAARKQAYFLEELGRMGPADMLPGVAALIDEAKAAGLAVGLASSSRNVTAVLARLGLSGHFDVVADGATVPTPKPDPAVFLWVSARLGVAPSATLVLEDSEAGVRAAMAGGFPVVALGPVAHLGVPGLPGLGGVTLGELVELVT